MVSPESLVTFVGNLLSAAKFPKVLKRNTAVVIMAARLRQVRAVQQQVPRALKWKFQMPAMRSKTLKAMRIIVMPFSW